MVGAVTTRIGAGLMALLLLLYLGLVLQLAIRLMTVEDAVSRAIGIALVVLPVLGLWALVAEIVFGIRAQRLGQVVGVEGDLPREVLPLRASGRPVRADADAAFPRYREAVESSPGDWKAWFRLGLAYDACGDRRRARSSIRRAIELSRER